MKNYNPNGPLIHEIFVNAILPIIVFYKLCILFSFFAIGLSPFIIIFTIILVILPLVLFVYSFVLLHQGRENGIKILKIALVIDIVYYLCEIIALVDYGTLNIFLTESIIMVLFLFIDIVFFIYYSKKKSIIFKPTDKEQLQINDIKNVVNNAINNNLPNYSQSIKKAIDSDNRQQELEDAKNNYLFFTAEQIIKDEIQQNHDDLHYEERLKNLINSNTPSKFDQFGKDNMRAGYIYAVICKSLGYEVSEETCTAFNEKQFRLMNNEAEKLLDMQITMPSENERKTEVVPVEAYKNEINNLWGQISIALGKWELIFFLSEIISFVFNKLFVVDANNDYYALFTVLGFVKYALYYYSIDKYWKTAPNCMQSKVIGICIAFFVYCWFTLGISNDGTAANTAKRIVMGIIMISTFYGWKGLKKKNG